MTPDQDRYLTQLTERLQAAYKGTSPLASSLILHARAFVRYADAGDIEVTQAADVERVDILFGLFKWGELVYPLQRLDPELFTQRRRAARAQVPARPQPEWRD